nr:odorant receptor OR29 [Phauda flammans]
MEEKSKDNHYLEPPKEQTFYRRFAFWMTFIDIGNQEWWGYETPNKLIVFHSKLLKYFPTVCVFLEIVYYYVHSHELELAVKSSIFIIMFMTIMITVKIWAGHRGVHEKAVTKFFRKYHLYNYYQEERNDFVKNTLITAEKLTRWTLGIWFLIMMFDWALWMIMPILYNVQHRPEIENRTSQLRTCLYMWTPFDYRYNYGTWVIVHIVNVYLTGLGCYYLVWIDVLNYAILFHLHGHIKILKHKILTDFEGDLNDMEIKKRLGKIVEYHVFILLTFKETEAAFGLNVGVNYLYNLITDSILLFLMMRVEKQDKVTFAIMLMMWMGAMILFSFGLEEIKIQSDTLPQIMYDVPWEHWSLSNQKMVVLLLFRMQPELAFKATGGMATGVRPMTSIIKSTFSYYVMLKSMGGE